MGIPDRRDVYRLAAEADVHHRTAAKALREGSKAIEGQIGRRVAETMPRIGLRDPSSSSPSAPPSTAA